jgi:hypothetical protein
MDMATKRAPTPVAPLPERINSPWKVLAIPGDARLPWAITDCYGTLVGRFDTYGRATRAANAVNHEVTTP